MRMRRMWWVAAVALVAAGCTGLETEGGGRPLGYNWDDPAAGPTGRFVGQTEFESAGPWMHIWGPWLRALGAEATDQGSAKRVIQESDIFAFEGSTLFVLNPYRGLVSIDLANPDRPSIVGRAPILGTPKDMIVSGGQAFVLMNDWFQWRDDDKFHGSQVLVVDVARPSAPAVVGQFAVAGNIEDSRLVGDVLYVVSTTWADQGETHLLSIDVSDPERITEVDRESFAGTGHVIHVTEEYVFAALYDWTEGPSGRIRAIDISDPRGRMALAGEVEVEGTVQDRFMLDFADGHLRVVSHDWQDQGHIYVDTFDAGHAMAHRGHLDLGGIGQLTAARFAEDRAYLVHLQRVDPLDVIDLQNPASPIRLSSLEIPGWLERLEIRGNTVVGIGFDAPGGPAPARTCDGYTYSPLAQGRKLAVALFDATDPAATCEAARVRFGEGDWAWSNAFWDDKSLRLIDDEGLLLVPFNAWLQDGSVNAVQLVDVDLEALHLAARGRVESLATVDRSFVRSERLLALGAQELLVADIENRDAPEVTAQLELARDVTAFSPIGSRGHAMQLVSAPNGDWNDSELRVVRASDPDASETALLSRVLVGAPAGELYVNGKIATVVSRRWTDDGMKVRIATFEVSNSGQIRARGQLELDGGNATFGPWFRRQNITDVLRVRANFFVVSNPTAEGLKLSFVSIANASSPRVVQEYTRPNDTSTVYDLRAWWNDLYVVTYAPAADGDEPEPLEGEFAITTAESPDGAEALTAQSRILPPFRPRAERVRYAVARVTFSNNGRATVGESVNVPGRLVDVSRNGRIWTLLDSRWTESQDHPFCGGFAGLACQGGLECVDDPRDACSPDAGGADCGGVCVAPGTQPFFGQTQDKAVFTVEVDHAHHTATLLDGIDVEEGVEDVKVRGNAAYYTTWDELGWMGPIDPIPLDAANDADGSLVLPAPAEPKFRLVILDVADPARIREASRTVVEENGSAGSLLDVREVDGTRYAFLGMGWGGVSVYDVTAPRSPSLDQFVRTLGWFSTIVVSPDQSAAYLASGLHGVQTILLDR